MIYLVDFLTSNSQPREYNSSYMSRLMYHALSQGPSQPFLMLHTQDSTQHYTWGEGILKKAFQLLKEQH